MRRTLLATAAALLPIAVLALANAQANQLLERNNFSAITGFSYINAAQCAGNATTDPLVIEFNIPGANSGTFTLFATNTQPAVATGGTVTLCAEQGSSPSGAPQVFAGSPPPGSVAADAAVKDISVSGSDAVKLAGKTCSSPELDDVWICAHWTNGQQQKDVASAIGHFRLQFAAPGNVGNVNVGTGDSKLRVSWDASTGGGTNADHYIAAAYLRGQSPATQQHPVADTPVATQNVTGTSATITGLANGTDYDVFVTPFSIGGNPGTPSGPVPGTPNPSADFWTVYKDRGGVEQGGCASGSGGVLALAAIGALAALRRRKP